MANDLGSRSLFIIVFEVMWLIILNGSSLIGNTLVCISVYRNKRLRTTTNLYIIALAVSDLLSAVLVMPFSTGVLITGKWIYGGAICQLHAFFSLFVIYVSPVTMGLTAVNRYVRICKSDRQYQKLFPVKKSRVLLAFAWTFVACYTVVPRLAGLQAFEFVPGYAQCSIAHLSESGKTAHYAIVLTLFFLMPLIATIVSYTKVAQKIRQHNAIRDASLKDNLQQRKSPRDRKNTNISAHEIKLSKSLFAVVFAFMICWIPFWIIVILRRFHLVAKMPRNVELFCMFLLYLSNAINPFIYAGMNAEFRGEFRKILSFERLRDIVVSLSDAGRGRSDNIETPNENLHRRIDRMANDLGSRSLFLTVFEVMWLVILNGLSLVGNTLVCISVYRNKRLRTTTNLYIIALAVSDLLSAVFVMPLSTGVLITSKWIYGGTICQLYAFLSMFVIYVSPVTMGLTAVNRFVRICKSDRLYQKLFSVKKSRLLLAFAWTFVACYTGIPRLSGIWAFEFVPGYAQCTIAHLSESGKTAHYIIVVSLFFLMPLIATIVSYTKVAQKIRQHNAIRGESLNTGISAHEIKLSKSLFAVVFAFMICWIPFWIIILLRRFRLVGKMPRSIELFCLFLFYLSNTINPLIYAGMNPEFRREFRKILFIERFREIVASLSDSGKGKVDDSETANETELN
ncbi:octopamine receptor beta-1R-like [Montipora foliosa]|uniref:octopamine receptor beta-1R-like n=1 Tax=Montipora foliosa TaxID=591990 RepID=UPI0035F1F7AE